VSIVVVIPSRGRPHRAWEAVQAIRETAVLVSTSVLLVIDDDDPHRDRYQRLTWDGFAAEVSIVTLDIRETGNLVKATNTVSMRVASEDPTAIIGNLGDDHLARTKGWDRMVTEALTTPGLAYGRDGIHDEHMPTAPFISATIPLALGWYALPTCRHLYVDNVWRDIAEQAGVRRYLPDMLFEHMHPAVAKGEWDAGYERANAQPATRRDHKQYELWRIKGMERDVARVRRAVAA
jgi:hypothetical protein